MGSDPDLTAELRVSSEERLIEGAGRVGGPFTKVGGALTALTLLFDSSRLLVWQGMTVGVRA